MQRPRIAGGNRPDGPVPEAWPSKRSGPTGRLAARLMQGVLAAGAGRAVSVGGIPTRSYARFLMRIVHDAGRTSLIPPTEAQMLQTAIRRALLCEFAALGRRIREMAMPGTQTPDDRLR